MMFGLAGVRKFGLIQKRWTFTKTGLIVLPSWLTFTCASTRTAQTSASTLITGVGSNQAVANMWGLQHEAASTNYSQYSQNFSSWGVASGTFTELLSQTDPAGTSTAITYTSLIQNSRGRYNSINASTAGTISCWARNLGSTPTTYVTRGGSTINGVVYPPGNTTNWNRFSASDSAIGAISILADAESFMTGSYNDMTNVSFAFTQVEGLPYVTSYIPNTSTASTTRAASVLRAKVTTLSRIAVDVEFVAACAPSVMPTTYGAILSDIGTGNYISLMQNGTITYNQSFFSATTYSWAAGDLVRIQVITGSTIKINVWVNGIAQTSSMISYAPSFTNSSLFLLNQSGVNFLPVKGIRSIAVG